MKTFPTFFGILFFSFATTLLVHSPLLAQASVAGRVTNGSVAAEFVNVILLAAKDSSLLKLALADERGHYSFTDIAAGEYFLRTSGLGYAEVDHPVFQLAEQQALELAVIDLSATALQLATVEVISKKPFLEQRAGRLIVNVSENITGQSGSVVDLLKKVPGIVVVGERVSMAGKSGLTILIDGRPTKYMDIQSLLREMPADQIKTIEVVSQPGAAFDAEGSGGIINIILKKNSLLGTNGNAYVGYGYGELAKYRTGFSLNHRAGAVNINGGLGYRRGSWIEGLDLDRTVGDEVFVQRNYEQSFSDGFSGNLGIDYDLNDRHRVGINSRAFYSDSPSTGENRTRIRSLLNTDEIRADFISFNQRQRQTLSFNTDVFYRWKIDTLGQELTLDGSYSRFDRSSGTSLNTEGDLAIQRNNDEPALAQIITAQADYKRPIGKKTHLQSGFKYTLAELDNELIATLTNNGNWENDRNLSNHYLYDESIVAFYTEAQWEVKKTELKAGLRYEYTRTEGNSLTLDSINTLSYNNLFPSLSLSTPFNDKLGIAAAYSYRLERPDYYDLNPFISFIDPFTFNKGNPFLRPEYIHSTSLSLTYEKQPFFNLSYDQTSNVLSDVTEQDDVSGVAFQTTVNLDRYTRYGGQLFFPLDWIAPPISGYAGVMGFYHAYSSNYLGGRLENDQFTWTGFAQVNVALPADWKLEVTGWFQGKGVEQGIIRHQALYGVDAGVQKKFFDNRLNVQLSADGIVRRFFTGNIRFQNQQMELRSYWEAPVFNGRITYNFGNRFLKDKESVKTSGSEARKRVNID